MTHEEALKEQERLVVRALEVGAETSMLGPYSLVLCIRLAEQVDIEALTFQDSMKLLDCVKAMTSVIGQQELNRGN